MFVHIRGISEMKYMRIVKILMVPFLKHYSTKICNCVNIHGINFFYFASIKSDTFVHEKKLSKNIRR